MPKPAAIMTLDQSTPKVADPDKVVETLCDGPFYFHTHGEMATLTLSHNRPKASQMFEQHDVQIESIVRARITMTMDNWVSLRDLLGRLVREGISTVQVPTDKAKQH